MKKILIVSTIIFSSLTFATNNSIELTRGTPCHQQAMSMYALAYYFSDGDSDYAYQQYSSYLSECIYSELSN